MDDIISMIFLLISTRGLLFIAIPSMWECSPTKIKLLILLLVKIFEYLLIY